MINWQCKEEFVIRVGPTSLSNGEQSERPKPQNSAVYKVKKVYQHAWQPFGPVFAAVAAGDDVPLQLDVLSFFALQTAVTQRRWVMILN